MKRIILTIAILSLLSGTVFAQAKTVKFDQSVNIKEILDQQVEEIKAKENIAENREIISSQKAQKGSVILPYRDVLIKAFVFIEGSLLILLLVYSRRKKIDKKRYHLSILKENIRRLRSERIGSVINNNLMKTRRKLVLQPVLSNGVEITERAKKLSISKGEIHLAAKIHLMMNNVK